MSKHIHANHLTVLKSLQHFNNFNLSYAKFTNVYIPQVNAEITHATTKPSIPDVRNGTSPSSKEGMNFDIATVVTSLSFQS